MQHDQIIPYGWEEVRLNEEIAAFEHPNEPVTIIARNTTPFRNYIPLITSDERTWEIAKINEEEGEVKFTQTFNSRTEAYKALQEYLENNEIEEEPPNLTV